MIEAGWKVQAADGTEIGHVVEVAGDPEADIFNGLAVASGLDRPHYVPSDDISGIVEGVVRLSLGEEQFRTLDEYTEPPPSLVIEAERAGLADRVVEDVERAIGDEARLPVEPKRVSLWARFRGWLKSLRGSS